MAWETPASSSGGLAKQDGAQEGSATGLWGYVPARDKYLSTLSILAFASGLGIATFRTMRRGRRLAAEDAIEAAKRSAHPDALQRSQGLAMQSTHSSPRDVQENAIDRASSKGITSLFVEINRAAFSRKARSQISNRDDSSVSSTQAPMSLRKSAVIKPARFGDANSESVFDASVSAPPPSVLTKFSKQEKKTRLPKVDEDIASPSHGHTLEQSDEADGANSVKTPLGQQPAIMAIKAFGIATAIVGSTAWLAVELGRRILKVDTVDELAEKLTGMVPSSTSGKRAASGVGDAARKIFGGEPQSSDEIEETTVHRGTLAFAEPRPVDEVVRLLDAAAERGDAAEWAEELGKQLDAERARDLAERRRRIEEGRQATMRRESEY